MPDLNGFSVLITACPYCGGHDVHETYRIEAHLVENVDACCLTCNEEFQVRRKLDNDDNEDE